MNNININQLLERTDKFNQIQNILIDFEKNKKNLSIKRGIYVYGDSGIGKTSFVIDILNSLNYDIIKYDAGDIRNKSVIDDITQHNMSDKNIMSIFQRKIRKIAIIMDEIDGMNNGDKGGINSLIKIIRPKKTKKQKLEELSMIPIICIGNYHIDKKIKELMKVCHVVELKTPICKQMSQVIELLLPSIDISLKNKIIHFVQGDLRKLQNLYNIYMSKPEVFNSNVLNDIFQIKSYNDDTKKITEKLLKNYYSFSEHNNIMNETDRTSIGLLWHENIIDIISKVDKSKAVPFYLEQLDNICFADYIDRITFQKQIWQFNEMSSLIKTFKNNKHYHEYFREREKPKYTLSEIRFTKVLTKYSTEYNNSIFIQNLCQELGMDKKDLIAFFIELKNKHTDAEIYQLFESDEFSNYEINKLDINRIYRYLDKYLKEDAPDTVDKEIIDLDDIMEEE
jgi:hypothetical protein